MSDSHRKIIQIKIVSNIKYSMTSYLKKWLVYCVTEDTYHTVWQESTQSAPTVCPVNSNDTIDGNITREIETINVAPRVQIEEEESLKTQGYFKSIGRTITIDGNVDSVTTDTLVWPFHVTILTGWFYSQDDQVGDSVGATVAPGVVVGALTAPLYSGNNEISVTQTVIDNTAVGHRIALTDGVHTYDMGRVTEINNNVYTMENNSSYTFSPLSPTYVKQTIDIIRDMKINVGKVRYAFAEKKQRGKGLPKNIPFVIEYHNHTGNTKQFSYIVEFMY
jgi:hypothetical protein